MNFVNGIISWNVANIHDLLGNKVKDPEFVKIISPNDIICLQETGCEVSLKGYKSYSDIRKSGRGGGVIVEYCSLNKCTLTADHTMNIVIVKITDPDSNLNTFVVNIATSHLKIALQEKIASITNNHSDELLLLGDLKGAYTKTGVCAGQPK